MLAQRRKLFGPKIGLEMKKQCKVEHVLEKAKGTALVEVGSSYQSDGSS